MNRENQINQIKNTELEKAELYIYEIINHVSIMGANDSEIPQLIKLIGLLKNGGITPEKAKEEAYKIQQGKSDYH